MARSIALVIGIAMVALAVAIPTALAEGRLAGSEPQGAPSADYLDAGARGAFVQQARGASSAYLDAGERGRGPAAPTAIATVSSPHGIEWPQVGVGMGIGIALGLVLVLGFRSTRLRPQAR